MLNKTDSRLTLITLQELGGLLKSQNMVVCSSLLSDAAEQMRDASTYEVPGDSARHFA